jgi:hypothetical protein
MHSYPAELVSREAARAWPELAYAQIDGMRNIGDEMGANAVERPESIIEDIDSIRHHA